MHTRSFLLLLVLCLGLGGLRADEPRLDRFTFREPHMGTMFKIIIYAPDHGTAERGSKAAFARIAQLDGIMSDYRSDSELMKLCAQSGGPAVPIANDLFVVLRRAQEVARLSGGAFDVTVGPVVRLWRQARRKHKLPDPAKLAEARRLVGFQNMVVDDQKHTVRLLKKGMLLDLGGIAKGYAGDAALEVLERHGITRALVAAGGDIVVGDAPPGTPGWTVAIAPVEDPDRKPDRYLILHEAAISTSGDAEQHLDIGGKRYSHIIDPRTGLGLEGRQSVTVVARRGIDSDSFTKVVSVLGPEEAFSIIDGIEGMASLVVRITPTGQATFESKRFGTLPKKKP